MAHLDQNNPSIWTSFSLGGFNNDVSIQTLNIWAKSSSGVIITEEVALQLATVWACIKVISEDIASLPWHVFQRINNERRERRFEHPVEHILNIEANEENDAFIFRELMLRWALSYGNGYAEIERDRGGRPQKLWPIHPENMRLMRHETTGELLYVVRNEHLFTQRDIFHLKGPSPDGLNGWPVLALALNTIGLGIASEQYGSEYFANGTHLTGLLKVPGVLTDESKQNLRDAWSRMYEGPTNRHKFAILDGGVEWHGLGDGVTMEQAEHLGTRSFQVNEICRWFRVSPTKVQDLSRATFTNIEHLSLEHVNDALMPWISRLEHEANRKLFTRKDMFSRVMVQAQLRSDSQTRAEFYKSMFNMGVLSINEIRNKEEQNPIGEEGEERFMQSGMTTVKKIVEEEEEPQAPPPFMPMEQEEEEVDVEQQAYAPILFDFFADAYTKKFTREFLNTKLAHYGRTVLLAHGRAIPANFYEIIEDFVVQYCAGGLTKPAIRFVQKILGADYANP